MFALLAGHAVHTLASPAVRGHHRTQEGQWKGDTPPACVDHAHGWCAVLQPLCSPLCSQNARDGPEDSEALEPGEATDEGAQVSKSLGQFR